MYSYTFDEETGGILLNSAPTVFSKEPRPVYAAELDLLGFDKYWNYSKQNDVPYMWAESVNYFYYGKLVARLKGGDLYHAPEIILTTDENGDVVKPVPDGMYLKAIDMAKMIEKNREIMDIIEGTTIKKIVKIYEKHKDKLDIFHVAFSGGKDSAVLLDLVKKALPKKSFVVIFGDTGMEFPDTYKVVEETKRQCEKEDVPFYIAKSHFKPEESWRLFGPPARVLRWCCSVHKSTPQTLKIREITGKQASSGLAFVGVRASESATRSEYEYENNGKKVKGQHSHNSILEWTSAEVWLYIFKNRILVNDAYKKGNTRAGCLMCPMNMGRCDYIKRVAYYDEVNRLENIIREKALAQDIDSYIMGGGWVSRRNGRDVDGNIGNYEEKIEGQNLIIRIKKPKTNWKEWIKTLGKIDFLYNVIENEDGLTVIAPKEIDKTIPGKYFKQVFHKVAYCVGCKVCESNCENGCISFENGLHITNCIGCKSCHEIDKGCLAYHSLELPINGGKRMKSINTFSSHAPKREWVEDFLARGNEFFEINALGPEQISFFKTFLNNCELAQGNTVLPLFEIINNLGWDSQASWGILLTNLAYNNEQIRWYTESMDIDVCYDRQHIEELSVATGDVNPKYTNFIITAFGRLCDLPLGYALNYGYIIKNGKVISSLARTKCNIPDGRVILYALYKFSEKCNSIKEFTLAWLMNDSVERDGVSPTRLFGLTYEEMKSKLMGLSDKYPDFINATFTNDLDKISLTNKTSAEVLALFTED